MSASGHELPNRFSRRQMLLAGGAMLAAGCQSPAVRSQSPEDYERAVSEAMLVRDLATPFGIHPLKIESPGLVVNLPGTGGDPPPSPERTMLLEEMQKRSVERPQAVLASPSTALVMVRGELPPGAQKGDRFDVDVWIPPAGEGTSLRDGVLLEARLRELSVQRGAVREGSLLGLAKGAVLVDPLANPEDSKTLLRRGVILGGGVCLKPRPLGLMLKSETRSVPVSKRVGDSINRRFNTYVHGQKTGVATPKTDGYVELVMHPRYKNNVSRYLNVLRAVAVDETPYERQARLRVLADQLRDPITAQTAALRLEAIGKEGVDPLKSGLESNDPEVRLYAAEALAYLDESAAAAPLARLARDYPAFRASAFTALGAMDDAFARDELIALLDAASAETRYGAFNALRTVAPHEEIMRGESMAGHFAYHVLPTEGASMIHISRRRRPEIVLFGVDQQLKLPIALDPSRSLTITSTSDGQLSIAKFSLDDSDQRRIVPNRLDDLIRTMVELGATYPDVVQALVEAKQINALSCRLELDALPSASRVYNREKSEDVEPA